MPWLLAAGGGAVVGFFLGRGTEALSSTVKWAVIGGAGFLAAKHFKVI
jgi:hypothetical protein